MEATVSSSEVDTLQSELDIKRQELDEVRESVEKVTEEVKSEKSQSLLFCFVSTSQASGLDWL